MLFESKVPALISENPIKAAHGRSAPLIAPGVFAVLEMYLSELARVKCCSKLSHAALVEIPVIFVPCSIN